MSAQLSPHPIQLGTSVRLAGPKISQTWLERMLCVARAYATRRQLLELDAHLLRDIGVTRLDARLEADRRPWDLGGR